MIFDDAQEVIPVQEERGAYEDGRLGVTTVEYLEKIRHESECCFFGV